MSLNQAVILQKWCSEAATIYGADWPRIENYIRDKLSALTEGERLHLEQQVSLLIAGKDDALVAQN